MSASSATGCGRRLKFGGYHCGDLRSPSDTDPVICDVCRAPATSPPIPSPEPDDIVMKSTRPLRCAVCREIKCGSVVLPDGAGVCGACCVVGLNHMIVDAAVVRGEGSGAFRASDHRLSE